MAETTILAIQWGAVICASLAAAIMDVRTRRIPNALCGPLFLAGLLWSFANGGFKGLGEGLAAAIILALPFVVLFLFAGGGAGDAKLAGAVGAWLSINEALTALVCMFIIGGLLAVIIAVYKKRLVLVLTNVFLIFFRFVKRGSAAGSEDTAALDGEKLTIPFGVAIFAGLCVAGVITWLQYLKA